MTSHPHPSPSSQTADEEADEHSDCRPWDCEFDRGEPCRRRVGAQAKQYSGGGAQRRSSKGAPPGPAGTLVFGPVQRPDHMEPVQGRSDHA